MFTVHATRTLPRRIGRIDGPDSAPGQRSTSALGDWYATALPWRPQVTLFVNETTLLPVLLPLAPAATVTSRLPAALAQTGADVLGVGQDLAAACEAAHALLGEVHPDGGYVRTDVARAGVEGTVEIPGTRAATPSV